MPEGQKAYSQGWSPWTKKYQKNQPRRGEREKDFTDFLRNSALNTNCIWKWLRKDLFLLLSPFQGWLFLYILMFGNFKLLFLPLDGGGQVGGEGKSYAPSPNPSHQGRGIFSYRRPNIEIPWRELITTPLSPPSQGGDQGEVSHRLFIILVMDTKTA